MKDSQKEAIRLDVIKRAEAVSDSIKLRHSEDDFIERVPEILDMAIFRAGFKDSDKQQIIDYCKPTVDNLLKWHNSR